MKTWFIKQTNTHSNQFDLHEMHSETIIVQSNKNCFFKFINFYFPKNLWKFPPLHIKKKYHHKKHQKITCMQNMQYTSNMKIPKIQIQICTHVPNNQHAHTNTQPKHTQTHPQHTNNRSIENYVLVK